MALATYAYIIAVFELLIGIPLLVSAKRAAKWMLQLGGQDALLRFMGAVFVVISVLVLINGCSVGADVAGLVRLLAWVIAIKCVMLCWWPQIMVTKIGVKLWSISWMPYLAGACAVALGILLILAGNDLQTCGGLALLK